MARALLVLWDSRRVGELRQEDTGQLRFVYGAAWLGAPGARPISHSLPLRPEPFDHRACRPFFAGLLPDAEKRDQVARVLGVTPQNDFALLDRIGGDCAGALALVEPGHDATSAGPPAYRVLDDDALAQLLRELPRRPLLAGEEGVRLSLAGAQDKLPIHVASDGTIALPLHGAPSTHIAKPGIPRVPGMVANEALCLRLARRLGLHAVDVEIRRVAGDAYLLVTRYDRAHAPDGTLERVHQEDFCQALGVPPETKYQSEGGPTLAACFALVREATTRPAGELLRLLDAVIFNALVGNNDAHAKNFSLVYRAGGTELAPLYDVVCTAAYPELNPRMAMKLGGQRELRDVAPRHWERFARECGLGAPFVKRRVVDLARRIGPASEETAGELGVGGDAAAIVAEVVRVVGERAGMAQRAFGGHTS
jgi:serine/threonine-protein kinase HipA